MMIRSLLRGPAALCALASALFAVPGQAQTPANGFDLSVRNIMRGPDLVGRSPDEVRFSEDGRWVYFRWRAPEARDTLTHVYRVPAAGGVPEMLADSVADRIAPVMGGSWDASRTRRAFARLGDVYVTDVNGNERRITQTPARETGPELSGDGRTVYWFSNNNIYATAVDGGPLRQLTDIRADAAPRDPSLEGQRGNLRRQQTELFDVIRDRVEAREARERLDSLRTEVRPVYIGKNASIDYWDVSPSGRYVLLTVADRVEGQQQTMVPAWVTETGYTEPMNVRTKVGDAEGVNRAAVLDLQTHTLTWVQLDSAQRARKVVFEGGEWAPGEDRALLIGIPFDFKDRWLYVVGPDAKVTQVDALRDTAWVGGPGLYTAGFVNNDRVYFMSERTGYAHLYTVPATGGRATPVTSGEWEVTGVTLSPDRQTFYLTTSETHPGERAVYTVPVTGGSRTRVTPLQGGWTEGTLSHDGRMLALLHSTANTPPELYLMPAQPGAQPVQVTESRTAEFRRGPWIQPQVVTFRASDGQTVYARIYRPREVGAQAHGGAVLFVHGAGYLQNAHRGWSTYFREYMFNHLLASRGYTVMDVDFRGSSGYGAAVRTGIYRYMGGKDLSDHVDAARWLVQNEGVDARRIGLYGGSYGGFITLMGLFTQPEVFRSGAALRSVTDWPHYNHWYTSRILNLPQEDTLAYRRSSPIYFAEGLRGDLLIAHGMVDTNVHFSDVVRLTQRLIELGKTNWELAVYPVEDHAFVRADSWADEYRRIYELFERTLRPDSPPLPAANPAPGR
jgi:dipeptidyl aminopeptidase/acylaminoacyl peptidase